MKVLCKMISCLSGLFLPENGKGIKKTSDDLTSHFIMGK